MKCEKLTSSRCTMIDVEKQINIFIYWLLSVHTVVGCLKREDWDDKAVYRLRILRSHDASTVLGSNVDRCTVACTFVCGLRNWRIPARKFLYAGCGFILHYCRIYNIRRCHGAYTLYDIAFEAAKSTWWVFVWYSYGYCTRILLSRACYQSLVTILLYLGYEIYVYI